MSLTIHGNTVTPQSKVTVCGGDCTTVSMYGNEVWRKDGWETLFSGSQVFSTMNNTSGSMSISGLKASDTVTISATAEYLEIYDNTTYKDSMSITRNQLPAYLDIYTAASVNFTLADGKINFKVNNFYGSYKGEPLTYFIGQVTITEVRRKL